MTSDQIAVRQENNFELKEEGFWLAEIAYQLAKLNERFAAQGEVDADINAMNAEAAARAQKEERPR